MGLGPRPIGHPACSRHRPAGRLNGRLSATAVSGAARSVFAFGVYFALLGLTLYVAPNALLGLFGLPPTEEVWIRVAGILALAVGFYYLLAARADLAVFFRWSV